MLDKKLQEHIRSVNTGTFHGFRGLVISVRPGDGMTSVAELAYSKVRNELGRSVNIYQLRGEPGVGQLPGIVEGGLLRVVTLARLARKHGVSKGYRFASPLSIVVLLIVAVVLGIASTMLTRLLSPRDKQSTVQSVADLVSDPAFLLAAGLAVIVGIAVKYVGEYFKPGVASAARKQFILDLEEAESLGDRWSNFTADVGRRLISTRARVVIIDGFDKLDALSRRTVREHILGAQSSHTDLWIVLEGSYSPDLRTAVIKSWTRRASPVSKIKVYDLLPLTEKERERLAIDIGRPERASYKTIRAICAPDTVPDQEIINSVDRYRDRQPDDARDYDALDLFYLLAVASVPDGGVQLSRDFLAKRLSDSSAPHFPVLLAIFARRPTYEDINIKINELLEQFAPLLDVTDDRNVAVDLEVANVIVHERSRWGLPDPQLVHLFWALLWWQWLAKRDPYQPFWIHRLANHIVESAAPSDLRRIPAKQLAMVRKAKLSASLNTAVVAINTCLIHDVPDLLDRIAYQLDPRSHDGGSERVQAGEIGWFAWIVTGNQTMLRHCLALVPDEEHGRVSMSDISQLHAETLPNLDQYDRRTAGISLQISEESGGPMRDWQRMYVPWLLANLAKASMVDRDVASLLQLPKYGPLVGQWLDEAAVGIHEEERAGSAVKGSSNVVDPAGAIRLLAMADAVWIRTCFVVHMSRSNALQNLYLDLLKTPDLEQQLRAALEAGDVEKFGLTEAAAEMFLELLPELNAAVVDANNIQAIRETVTEMLADVADAAQSALSFTGGRDEFLRECAAKQALVVAAAAANLLANVDRDPATVRLLGRCLSLLGAHIASLDSVDDEVADPIIQRYLQIFPVAWRAFAMEGLSSLAEVCRLEYHLLHLATQGTVEQLQDASEAFASGAVQRGCDGVIACLIASLMSEASQEVAARHLVRSAECALDEGLGPRLTTDLCLLSLAASHSYDIDVTSPLGYMLRRPNDEESATPLGEVVNRATDAVFEKLAFWLMNLANAVKNSEQAEQLLHLVSARIDRFDDPQAAVSVRAFVDEYHIKTALKFGTPLEIPSLVARWQAGRKPSIYAYILYLLLKPQSPHVELLTQESVRVLDEADTSDNGFALLATELLHHADGLGLGHEARSVAVRVLSDALPVWENKLSVDTTIEMLEELIKNDQENEADYLSRLDARKTIKLTNDRLKLAEWRRRRAYFLEFSYYVRTLAFYGLPIFTDAPDKPEVVARWKADGAFVPNVFMKDAAGPKVSLRFLTIGTALYSQPAASDVSLDADRDAFNSAAYDALPAVLQELASLHRVPEAIRELLLRQRSSLLKPKLPRELSSQT